MDLKDKKIDVHDMCLRDGMHPKRHLITVEQMVDVATAMDEAGFGNCRNYGECSAACPKDISLDYIAKLNRDHAKAKIKQIFS